jgi:predicted nucleic acid-binding protein
MAALFVVDCSLAAKWILPEPGHAVAVELYEQYAAGEIRLIAPDLLLTEFASLLAKRFRRKQLSAAHCNRAFDLMRSSVRGMVDTQPRLATALALALAQHISLWDSVYLAVAREYDCPLATADARLARAAKGTKTEIVLVQ